MSGDTLLAGVWVDPAWAPISGPYDVYVFARSGGTWTVQQKLVPSGGTPSYGRLAVSGDSAVVSSPSEGAPPPWGLPPWQPTGAVYVFARTGATWNEQQRLTVTDAGFGAEVAIDGDTLVASGTTQSGTPAVHFYARSGSSWSLQQSLELPTLATVQAAPWPALSGDTAMVAVSGDGSWTPSARVLARSGTTWSEVQRLVAGEGPVDDALGTAVGYGMAGAPGADVAGRKDVGAVLALSPLVDPELTAGARLGSAMAGSGVPGGRTAVAGAPHAGVSGQIDAGCVYAFMEMSGSTWQKLTADDAKGGDELGAAVAIDGLTVVAGAPFADESGASDAGAAYVFVGSTQGPTWTQQAKLVASDSAIADRFGSAVAVSGDDAVAGAPFADPSGATDSGAAYVFGRTGGSWKKLQKMVASDAAAGD